MRSATPPRSPISPEAPASIRVAGPVWVRALLAAMVAVAIGSGAAAVADLGRTFSDPHPPDIMVGGPLTIPVDGLMPGDRVATSITLRSAVAGRYHLQVRANGLEHAREVAATGDHEHR